MSSRWPGYGLALFIFFLDRLTKLYIEHNLAAWDVIPVIPGFFNIVHTQNRGAAFGFLSDSTGAWRTALLVGVSLVVLGFIGASMWRPSRAGFRPSPLLMVGLGLVFGGALGNVYDRLTRGSVTDFLQFFFGSYEFPSFNVADSAITVGAGLLILDMWRSKRQPVST